MPEQTIFPAVRYVDPRAAIAWLGRAFGAETHVMYDDDGGDVAHAEVRIAGNLVMLGTSRTDDPYPVRSPRVSGGTITASLYVVLADAAAVDAMHARAAGAGAEIAQQPHDTDYGSHDFSARDLDGHYWTFGTYHPEHAAG